jgi:hypothetical protein
VGQFLWALAGVLAVAMFLWGRDPLALASKARWYAAAVALGALGGPVFRLWPFGAPTAAAWLLIGLAWGLGATLWATTAHGKPCDRLVLLLALALGLMSVHASGPAGGPGRLLAFLTSVLGLSPVSAEAVNFAVRKSAHLLTYGAMAWSAGRWVGGGPGSRLAAGYGWALPHACLDEFLQSQHPGIRTGSLGDLLLDVLGMTALLAPEWRKWWAALRQRQSG